MPTSETLSPVDDDAAAVRYDCVSCKPPNARECTCGMDSPPTSSSAKGEGKAEKKASTREDLVGGAVSYAGGLTGMRAREDEEERRLRRERQLYEAISSKNRASTQDVPKASSNDSTITPAAQATEALTRPKLGSDVVVSVPEGSAAECTQTQVPNGDEPTVTVRAPPLRKAKSAKWSEENPYHRRLA